MPAPAPAPAVATLVERALQSVTEPVAEPKQRSRHAGKDKPQHGHEKKEQDVPTAPQPEVAPPPAAPEPVTQPCPDAPVADDETAEPIEAPAADDAAGKDHGRGHAWGHEKK